VTIVVFPLDWISIKFDVDLISIFFATLFGVIDINSSALDVIELAGV